MNTDENEDFRGSLSKWFPLRRDIVAEKRIDLSRSLFASYIFLIDRYWIDGFLPDDDAQLAKIAGMTVKSFRRNKAKLLKDFEKLGDKFSNIYFNQERKNALDKRSKRRMAVSFRLDRQPTNVNPNSYNCSTSTVHNNTGQANCAGQGGTTSQNGEKSGRKKPTVKVTGSADGNSKEVIQ